MRSRALLKLVGLVTGLGLLAGGAGAVLVLVAPLPAAGQPVRYLLRNGSASGVDAGDGPVWILALGSDARPGEDLLRQRSDAVHLIGVNPSTGAGVIAGFPRDSYVNIPGYGTDKINSALTYGGPAAVAATVAQFTGITPQYVFITGFEGLQSMVDRLGGVTVEVDVSMSDPLSGSDFSPGPVTMAGGQALAFTRDRHLTGGDFARSKHQSDLLLAVLSKMKGASGQRGQIEAALPILLDNTVTDVPPAEVFRLARAAMTVDPARVANFVVPGTVGTAGAASVVFLDEGYAASLFEDVKQDATLDQPIPPIPPI